MDRKTRKLSTIYGAHHPMLTGCISRELMVEED